MSENNIAIVTGANKGLGFAVIKRLCENFKGTVYLTSRDEKRGKLACENLQKLGYNPKFCQLDVTDDTSIERFYNHIKKYEIEVIINNAGILFLKDAMETKLYQAEQTILVNFFALANFCEKMLPLVKEEGKIVNVSSSSGHLCRIPSEDIRNKFKSGDLTLEGLKVLMHSYLEAVKENEDLKESWGDSPYVVSKVGVNAYTFILNRDLSSRGIKVNCVHPGYVISDMTRGAGNVTPEDAAELIMKVALDFTEGGHYIWSNGQSVPWDGADPRQYIDGKQI